MGPTIFLPIGRKAMMITVPVVEILGSIVTHCDLRDQHIKCIPRKDTSFGNVVYLKKINAKD